MANHTTGAERYNKRMNKIFEQAKINTNNWGDKMPKHTPTPWEYVKLTREIVAPNVPHRHTTIEQNICKMIGQEQWESTHANAALIVKAVNSHAELVNALQYIRNELSGQMDSNQYLQCLKMAKQALAKAGQQ